VERYNRIQQLRNILCNKKRKENIKETLEKYIFPKEEKDEVRLTKMEDNIEVEFNRIFELGVNSELIG